jgi:hypothetical protein
MESDSASEFDSVGASNLGASASTDVSVRQVPPGMVLTTGGSHSSKKSNSETPASRDEKGTSPADAASAAELAVRGAEPVADSTTALSEGPLEGKAPVISRSSGSEKRQQWLDEPARVPRVEWNTPSAVVSGAPSRLKISQPAGTVGDVAPDPGGPTQQAVTARPTSIHAVPQPKLAATPEISSALQKQTVPRSEVSEFVLGALASAGLGPLATDSPIAPDSPVSWAVLAVARSRRFGQTVVGEADSPRYSPTATSRIFDGERTFAASAMTADTLAMTLKASPAATASPTVTAPLPTALPPMAWTALGSVGRQLQQGLAEHAGETDYGPADAGLVEDSPGSTPIAAAVTATLTTSTPPKPAPPGVQTGIEMFVTNWQELDAALVPANAGRTIHMGAGEYVATHALVIPEGVTLVGDGEMLTNADGLPIGFAPGTLTTLRATAAVQGDFITMLDGSKLRNIQIVDTEQPRPFSNVVAIVSQHPFDSISAEIVACEIQNFGTSGVGPNGPTGRAVLILNRTMQVPSPVAMHEGSSLDVRITRSIIRSFNNGSGIFAINFAADSNITLDLSHNYIGGGLDAAGGVSRPLEVSNSVTEIRSDHNLYRSDQLEGGAPAAVGWSLLGGTGPPPPLPIPSTHDNTLVLISSHDRIEGFRIAINGSAARRAQPTAGPSSNNTLILELSNARLSSLDADIRLSAAETLIPTLTPGDNNITIFRAHNVIGSGPRLNYFGHVRFSPTASPPSDLDASLTGNGNRLEIVGAAAIFEHHNSNIQPGPRPEFFTDPGLPRCNTRCATQGSAQLIPLRAFNDVAQTGTGLGQMMKHQAPKAAAQTLIAAATNVAQSVAVSTLPTVDTTRAAIAPMSPRPAAPPAATVVTGLPTVFWTSSPATNDTPPRSEVSRIVLGVLGLASPTTNEPPTDSPLGLGGLGNSPPPVWGGGGGNGEGAPHPSAEQPEPRHEHQRAALCDDR